MGKKIIALPLSIAMAHTTVVFAFNIAFHFVFGLFYYFVSPAMVQARFTGGNMLMTTMVLWLMPIFSIWVSVMFSSTFIRSTYVINDPEDIAARSTLLWAVLMLVMTGPYILSVSLATVMLLAALALKIVIFNYFSRIYL